MLQCRHKNERLEFGMENAAILSHSFFNNNGSVVPCRTVLIDMGLSNADPGLSPNGAKCGENMVCNFIIEIYSLLCRVVHYFVF